MWRCILRSRSGRSHASSLPELGRLRPKGWSRVPVPRWRGLRDEPKEPLRGKLHQKKPPFYPKYIKSNVPCLSTDGFIFLSTVSWINKQMLLPRQMWVSSRYESNLSVWTNSYSHSREWGSLQMSPWQPPWRTVTIFSRFSGKHEAVVEHETRAFPVARDSLSTSASRAWKRAKIAPIL